MMTTEEAREYVEGKLKMDLNDVWVYGSKAHTPVLTNLLTEMRLEIEELKERVEVLEGKQ
jgi:uncharacterized membrane protein YfbV (UPF0208 family)